MKLYYKSRPRKTFYTDKILEKIFNSGECSIQFKAAYT